MPAHEAGRGPAARETDAGSAAARLVLAVSPPLLAWAAIVNPDRLNPDAVAYLTLARHWRDGAVELALSGYWGPLFPWLAALLRPLTGDLLAAGRAAMAGSAFLFLAGGIEMLRALELAPAAVAAGAVVLLGFAPAWSVAIMTPDLLMTGLLLLGVAVALGSGRRGAGRDVLAGALVGLAYHAKAVALPLGFGLLLAAGLWRALAVEGRRAARACLVSLAAMALVAAPWVALLSAQYGKPSIGTSGAVNFAIAGPAYVAAAGDRIAPHHPAFTGFHAPRAGRVTAWEEATELPYVTWSPLADAAAARHLLRVVRANAEATLATLRGFDALGLGLAALVLAPLAAGAGLRPWRFALVPVAMLAAIYLPVMSNGEPRYLMPGFPLLFAAAAGLALWLAAQSRRPSLARAAALLLLLVCFLLPLRHDIAVSLAGRPNPHLLAARHVAAEIRAQDVPGGIASVGELGFAAIFTAFLLERPFLGTEAALPDLAVLERLGAGVLLVAPGGAADRALAAEPRARRLSAPGGLVAAWRLR